jgi:hypothetical protein
VVILRVRSAPLRQVKSAVSRSIISMAFPAGSVDATRSRAEHRAVGLV